MIKGMVDFLNSHKERAVLEKLRAGIERLGVDLTDYRFSFLILLIPLLILISKLNDFPYPGSGAQFSDISISHYPNHIFLREALVKFGEIPLWSSTILSGYPFFANPLSGLMYPIGWLALIMPLPLGFNILVTIHIIWGGLGFYLLLKREGLSHVSALLASLSFVLLPKLYSHYGAGHLTLLYAVPWTPWLLWSQLRSTQHPGERRFTIPPGLILALVIYADVRWGAFAALLWWAYAIVHRRTNYRKVLLRLSGQTLLALFLAAPLLVPLAEYTLLSTRAALEGTDNLAFSLPIASLVGLLFPNWEAYHEWVLYPGGIVFALAFTSILLGFRVKWVIFWLGVLIASILIALGSQVPGMDYLSQLPVANLLRVPSRSLFIAGLSLAALSGYGLEGIIGGEQKIAQTKRIRLFLFGLFIFNLTLAFGMRIISGTLSLPIVWGLVMSGLGVLWIWMGVSKKVSISLWVIGVITISVLDLAFVSTQSFRGRPAEQVLTESKSVADYLSEQPGKFRTYSPSYSIPQQTAVGYQIELADGVDPLQLSAYSNYMQSATGIEFNSYSVTLPPYKNGDPLTDNAASVPDPEKLAMLNVGFVVAEYDLPAEGLTLAAQFQRARIYKNEHQLPRAWVETKDNNAVKGTLPADIVEASANRILLSAIGPGTLVLSEIYYPGWEAKVDGETEEIHNYQGILRSIDLGPGKHEIEFRFRPGSLFVGLGLMFLGILALGWRTLTVKKHTRF